MTVFIDTGYLIALLNPDDQLHERAERFAETLSDAALVTADFVFSRLRV